MSKSLSALENVKRDIQAALEACLATSRGVGQLVIEVLVESRDRMGARITRSDTAARVDTSIQQSGRYLRGRRRIRQPYLVA